jgi:hypothetical protein
MRIVAAHDAQGNIDYVVISPADAPLGTVTTDTNPGLLVTEVEVPETLSKLELTGPEAGRQLEEVLRQEFQVEAKGKGKLVPKGKAR